MTVLENPAVKKNPRGNLWNPNVRDLARKTLDLAWDTIIQSEPLGEISGSCWDSKW